jgi:voltage-gated potassium channel
MRSFKRQFLPLVGLLLGVLAFGVAGYYFIEGWSFLDSLYMVAITLTTVGFGEVQPLSNTGRIFTILFLLVGVVGVAYTLSAVGEYILTSNAGQQLRKRRVKRMIERMRDHVVVCGYGRVGQNAVSSLLNSGQTIVVIERDERIAEQILEAEIPVIIGDATQDDTLRQAGIESAKGMIVSAGDDSVNLFIVLSARTLNPELYIVARSVNSENELKMRRAGANRVVSPYQLGGRYMANVLTRPHVTEFIGTVTLDSGIELWMEELKIGNDSSLAGHTVVEADLRRRTGVTLVALLRESKGATLMPDENTQLEVGDELIVLGTREQLTELEELTGSLHEE